MPSKRPKTSPVPSSSSRSKTPPTRPPPPTPKPSSTVSSQIDKRRAELEASRAMLGLTTAPVKVLMLFSHAALEFLGTTAATFATSRAALALYAIGGAYAISAFAAPGLYAAPMCGDNGTPGGLLFLPALYVYETLWWLILGVLSSIGFGTGLHSGIMFLWPFVIRTINQAEACGSSRFPAAYSHPCALECPRSIQSDGSNTFFNLFLVLLPMVVLWGSGTAIGELPPFFITRAARRAGGRATGFESELAEAKEGTDIVSRMKVWTIQFTENNGFFGILLLASWPNAAFDMCGMACGWLEMPFWTFFGATLLGKGFIKVSLQTMVCIVVFGPTLWSVLKGLLPDISLPRMACANAGVPTDIPCTLVEFLSAGRDKAMLAFSLQTRYLPLALLDGTAYLDQATLVDKYCAAMAGVCGTKAPFLGTYSNAAKYGEMLAKASRAVAEYDQDGDGRLTVDELSMAVSASDGKLSLASLDPGTGRLLSVGTLWNTFIAGLIIFFLWSIVVQVATSTQASNDEAELVALEATIPTGSKKTPAKRTTSKKAKAD